MVMVIITTKQSLCQKRHHFAPSTRSLTGLTGRILLPRIRRSWIDAYWVCFLFSTE